MWSVLALGIIIGVESLVARRKRRRASSTPVASPNLGAHRLIVHLGADGLDIGTVLTFP
jgi:hypothetical protein